MKLSNKVLIGLIGVIFIYINLAFIEIGFRGKPRVSLITEGISEVSELDEFNYLVIEDFGRSIKVIGSDKFALEMRSLEGGQLETVHTEYKQDTLILKPLNVEREKPFFVKIYVEKGSLKGVQINNARSLTLDSLEQVNLEVSHQEGWITLRRSKFDKITLRSGQGGFTIRNSELDSLTFLADQSRISVESTLKHVSGSLKNESSLRLKGVRDIQVRSDETSRMDLN